MGKLGLLAGLGKLPVEFAKAARAMGLSVFAISLVEGVDQSLKAVAADLQQISIARLDEIITYLKENEITKVTMIGKVTKEILFSGNHDVVIAISNSGETAEVVNILSIIKRIGATIIAMSGRRESSLGRNAEHFIDVGVEREACPLGLAPTASTTATLAMGDAITIALLSARNFTAQDFAVFHPGGALGRRLLLTVENVMHSGEDNPVITIDKTAKEALFMMTEKGLGATSVVDAAGSFIGLVTDGDIRRCLSKGSEFLDETVEHLMTKNPQTITKDKLAAGALSLMEKHKPRPITVLPVIDENNHPIGIVHLTDLLRQGVV